MILHSVSHLDDEALSIYKNMRDNITNSMNSAIADSPKVVNMLLQNHVKVISILATQEYYDTFKALLSTKENLTCYVASKALMQSIVGHKIHHNVMMHFIRPNNTTLNELGNNIIMLDNITSSENVGSIARSAAALGVHSYLLPSTSPHPYNRRALRVSMGHVTMLNVAIYDDIIETIISLQKRDYKVYAAEVTANAITLNSVITPKKWVILMGHEGKGIAKEILDICDAVVKIDMHSGVNSFNVGVAASLMMYHFTSH